MARWRAPGQLPEILAAAVRRGFDLVALDTTGVLSPAANQALRAAHLVLVQARPTLLATEPTLRVPAQIVLAARVALLLSQCLPQGQVRTAGYAERLRRWGHLAEPPPTQRVDH